MSQTFDVRYRPEANGPFKRLRRQRYRLLFVLATIIIGPLVLLDLPMVFSDPTPLGMVIALTWGVAIGALLGAVSVTNLSPSSGRRASPPPVALRLSAEGVWVWPMVGADFFLPWLCVGAIEISPAGIAVFARKGVGPDTPGTMGMTEKPTLLLIRRPHLQHKEGLDWESLEPLDLVELDLAAREFSAGRVPVLRK